MTSKQNVLPFLLNNRAALMGLFENKHFMTSDSPMLASCDVGGQDDETIYINWHDAEGEEFSVEIPFGNLDFARIEDDALFVPDKHGTEERIVFFECEQIREHSPQKITHRHKFGVSNWVIRLPAEHHLPEGVYADQSDEDLPVTLLAVCRLLGIDFEPEKGEEIQVEDFLPSVDTFSKAEVAEAIKAEEGA